MTTKNNPPQVLADWSTDDLLRFIVEKAMVWTNEANPTSAVLKTIPQGSSGIGSGQTDVAAAGVRVPLAVSTTCKSVTVKAKAGNGGNIFIGGSNVNAANGYPLDAGDSVPIDISNLSSVYIDTDNNGDGVSYVYVV